MRATALLCLALLAGGCDSTEPEVVTAAVEVSVLFPDGTPAPALVTLVIPRQIPPAGPIIPGITLDGVTDAAGVARFDAPPGVYALYVEQDRLRSDDPLLDTVFQGTVTAPEDGTSVSVQSYLGYTRFGDVPRIGDGPTADLHLTLDGPQSGPGQSGYVDLIRIDTDALHVGQETHLIKRMFGGAFHLEDKTASQVTVEFHRIPTDIPWPSEALTYDTFDTLTPWSSQTVDLTLDASGVSPRWLGCVDLDMEPALFFDAPNGVALLVRGDRIQRTGDFFTTLQIAYTWEGGTPQHFADRTCL